MKIHHIGYLVKRMPKAIAKFTFLGYVIESEEIVDDHRKAAICFMVNGEYRVELICPLGKDSPIYGLLSKYRNSPYHICYECHDIKESIMTLSENGFTVIQEPQEAVAISGKPVAFMMGADLGMIELLEL